MFSSGAEGGTQLFDGPMAAGQWLAVMAPIQSTPELPNLSIPRPRLQQSAVLGGVVSPNG